MDKLANLVSVVRIVLPFFYWFSGIFYFVYFLKKKPKHGKVASLSLLLTIILHTFYLVLKGVIFKYFPIINVFEAFSVLAFAIAIIYFIVETTTKVGTTGIFMVLIVCLLQTISSSFTVNMETMPKILKSNVLFFHTSSAILAYTAFFMATVYSTLFVTLFQNLKKSKFGLFFNRLPSLEALDNMANRSMVIGVFFMALAIILGSFWKKIQLGLFFDWDPKIITAYFIFTIYIMILLGKKVFHWSRVQLSYFAIVGFLLIIFSMTVVNFATNSFHKFN